MFFSLKFIIYNRGLYSKRYLQIYATESIKVVEKLYIQLIQLIQAIKMTILMYIK